MRRCPRARAAQREVGAVLAVLQHVMARAPPPIGSNNWGSAEHGLAVVISALPHINSAIASPAVIIRRRPAQDNDHPAILQLRKIPAEKHTHFWEQHARAHTTAT